MTILIKFCLNGIIIFLLFNVIWFFFRWIICLSIFSLSTFNLYYYRNVFFCITHVIPFIYCWYRINVSTIINISWNPTWFNANRWRRRLIIFWLKTWQWLFYASYWFLFLRNSQNNRLSFLYCIITVSQCNNGYFFVRCSYSTMNIDIFSHFVSIMNFLRTSLLCYSILEILLKLVLSSKLWLIIWKISSRLWFIIWLIMLYMRLKIMILFYFTKIMCLWD